MPIKFAIVGCGRIAERHADNIIKIAKLIAVCDTNADKANKLAAKYNVRPSYSLDDLLMRETELDVVSICTPNGLHALQSIQCLQAGLHVICEKPLCIKTEDGKAMIAAAEEAGKKLFVVKSARFTPVVAGLKTILEQNKLGNVYSFQLSCFWNRPSEYYNNTWRGSLQLDGGILFTQFSHYIDVIYWLFGDLKNVLGIRKNFAHKEVAAFEDCGVAALEMENGIIGSLNYSINTFKKNMEVSLTVIGEKGTVSIGGEYMNKIKYQLIDEYNFVDENKVNETNNKEFHKGSMSNHDKVYENLLLALKDDNHSITTAIDGLKTVCIIEKIYRECGLLV